MGEKIHRDVSTSTSKQAGAVRLILDRTTQAHWTRHNSHHPPRRKMITLCKNVLRFVQMLKCVSFALRKIVFTWIIEDWSGSVQVSPCCPVVQTEKKNLDSGGKATASWKKCNPTENRRNCNCNTSPEISCLRI